MYSIQSYNGTVGRDRANIRSLFCLPLHVAGKTNHIKRKEGKEAVFLNIHALPGK